MKIDYYIHLNLSIILFKLVDMKQAYYTAIIAKDESGMWAAFVEEFPGANAQGSTKAEALENLKEAIDMIAAYRRDKIEQQHEGPYERTPLSVSLA